MASMNINDTTNVTGMTELLSTDIDFDDMDFSKLESEIMNSDDFFEVENKKEHKVDNFIDSINNINIENNSNEIDDFINEDNVVDSNSLNEWSEGESDGEDTPENYQSVQNQFPNWNSETHIPKDKQFKNMTLEQMKQNHVNNVLSGMNDVNDDAQFIDDEADEVEMLQLIEHIDMIRTTLMNEGVDVSRVPEVTINSSKKEAKNVLKILQIKNDRLRYCDVFEEGILGIAYGLESMFDGKKEWFGSKIDLVGWPETVKIKIRRMRYDTSSFVSSVMQGYQVSHGWRIILELLPSIFLYSRDRRIKTNDTLASDADYKNALAKLNF